MAKRFKFTNNPFLNIFKGVFVGMFGIISAYMMIALYSIIFVGTGYYIIQKYNKENTKLFEDIQTGQYLGIALAIIGLLPWMQYFFMSFMFEAGSYGLHELIDN